MRVLGAMGQVPTTKQPRPLQPPGRAFETWHQREIFDSCFKLKGNIKKKMITSRGCRSTAYGKHSQYLLMNKCN